MSIPRTSLPTELSREELKTSGVYILIGQKESDSRPTIYVDAGELVCNDLELLDKKKAFWSWAIVFTGKSSALSPLHIQYLKSRFIKSILAIDQVYIENNTDQTEVIIDKNDHLDLEDFLTQMLTICPVLGLKALESSA